MALDFIKSVFGSIPPVAPVETPDTQEDVNLLLGNIGIKMAQLQKVEAQLNEEIHQLTQKYVAKAKPIAAVIAVCESQIEQFMTAQKYRLLKNGNRSIQLPNGEVGWRKNPDKLFLPEDLTEGDLCRKMQSIGLGEYVRDDPTIQRDRVKTDFEKRSEFRSLGFRISNGKEKFFTKPTLTKLEK